MIAVCSQIHTKYINTLCGRKLELLNVKLAVSMHTRFRYAVQFSTRMEGTVVLPKDVVGILQQQQLVFCSVVRLCVERGGLLPVMQN